MKGPVTVNWVGKPCRPVGLASVRMEPSTSSGQLASQAAASVMVGRMSRYQPPKRRTSVTRAMSGPVPVSTWPCRMLWMSL